MNINENFKNKVRIIEGKKKIFVIHILAAMYLRPMNMVQNFGLGSGLSSGVSHPICIFMNIGDNFLNNMKIIGKNTFVYL